MGVAAHITAASAGGPRYDPSLIQEQRRHPDNGIWLCRNDGTLVDADQSAFTVEELRGWKASAERQAESVIGRPLVSATPASPTGEAEIRRDLDMKRRLRKALPVPFRGRRVIVRSSTDNEYPNASVGSGISSWFRIELWDFYYRGLEAILGIVDGVIDVDGHWSVLAENQVFDSARFEPIRMWQLGGIRYRDMVEFDPDGDELYAEPHIFCHFSYEGSPFGEVEYRRLTGNGDWPLPGHMRIDLRAP